MPSLEHETLVDLFSRDPRAAVELLRATGKAKLPIYDALEVRAADERELAPVSVRVDVVVLLRRRQPVYVILLEVQLGRDDDKLFSWPFYVAAVRLRYRCPVCLLVYAPHEPVARWCAQAIELGQPDSAFVPLVVGPAQVPRIERAEVAEQMPYAAILSAVAHGREGDTTRLLEAVWSALERLSEDERLGWVQVLWSLVDDAAKKILEAKMNLEAIKEELPFFIEGRAKGKVEGLRVAVRALAEVLGLDGTEARETQLETMDADALQALLAHLKSERDWPA